MRVSSVPYSRSTLTGCLDFYEEMRCRIYRYVCVGFCRNRRNHHQRGKSGGAITQVGIALTFGLIVLAMIYTVGDISGAHLNPAVSLGFFAARRFPLRDLIPYVLSQCAGAFAASGTLRFLFPNNAMLGATLPAGSAMQSSGTRVDSHGDSNVRNSQRLDRRVRKRNHSWGIAVGAVIGLEAMFAGPICGASMNPARSLAPAVVSYHLSSLWIYLIAPPLGASLAVLACRCVREEGCCAIPSGAASSES